MGKLGGLGLHLIFISYCLVAIAYTCLGVGNRSAACSEQERLALLRFKHSVKDDYEILSSWIGNDCCRWERIQCDVVTGNVESLHVRGDRASDSYYPSVLVGKDVSSSLAKLRHLKYLDLSGNDFSGSQIPEFIGSLKQLRYLNLSFAGFKGGVPDHIGNLSNLKVLDLSTNYELMIGDVAWTFGLSSLEHLDLSFNDLSGAQSWDMLLFMIPSLKELSLSYCQLPNAYIRPFLNSSRILPKIQHLDLSDNSFKGPIPHFFQNLTSLEFLDLSNFDISLAWNLENLLNMIPSLSELHLSRCWFDETFLSFRHLNFSTHSNIQHLDLSDNSIEFIFPYVLTNLSSLRVLDLSRNMLNSSVPVMPSLLELDLSSNQFEHIEHVGIWRWCHLKKFIASNNPFGIEMIDSPTNVSECSQYALERLDLSRNLYGTIPDELGRLGSLRGINLSNSGLTGPIPESLGKLRFLEVLDLSGNQITGPIPIFLGNLSKLDLSFNQLNGSIPESFGNSAALKDLNLEFNRLTGPVPASLGRLGSLTSISVSSNLLNGTLPVSIGQLAKLHTLHIANNSLEGVVSEAHFTNLSMLKDLDTSSNTKLTFNVSLEWVPPFQLVNLQLSSCNVGNGFPQWLRNQWKLELLALSNATISGPLPKWLWKMKLIFSLDLSHNKLSGPLTNLPIGRNFSELFMENNLLSGSIPMSLCRLNHLQYLDLSRNRLIGEIPKCLGNLQHLMAMRFGSNQLSGVVPSDMGFLSLLRLSLNDNKFIGELPRELGNLGALTILDLGDNEFSGSIPEWIGENLTSLMVLRLHGNKFTGRIPQSLCKASYLRILDVACNTLTGTIPHCLGDLMAETYPLPMYWHPNPITNYDEYVIQAMKGVDIKYTKTWDQVYNMDLSSNKLVGEIPVQLTALHMLMGLNLSNNHLSGGIPDDIGNMAQLFSLDLSRNELTGRIPPSMAGLNFLSHLNLSHNNFSGRIPTGSQLQTLIDPSIYDGNKDLCGPPLPKSCSNHQDPTTDEPTKIHQYKAGDESTKVWLFYLDIMCGFAAGFWGIIGVLLFKKHWRMKLFMFAEETIGMIHVAVAVRVAKMKRGREVA